MSGITIADIQAKIVSKFDEKYKGGMTKQRLERMFREADKDADGFITFPEFKSALEQNVNALSDDEAAFLFQVCFDGHVCARACSQPASRFAHI